MVNLRKILLVEDSRRDAELALDAFKENNLANEVVHVRDGEEALEYLYREGSFANLPEEPVAFILLDLKMPKLDGLEVLRQIRSTPRLQTLPVVMMTSSREERDVLESYQLGVNAYIVKPLGFQELVEAVRQVGSFWAVLNEPPPWKPT